MENSGTILKATQKAYGTPVTKNVTTIYGVRMHIIVLKKSKAPGKILVTLV